MRRSRRINCRSGFSPDPGRIMSGLKPDLQHRPFLRRSAPSSPTGINFAIKIDGRQVDAANEAMVHPSGAENWELNGYAYATQYCQR